MVPGRPLFYVVFVYSGAPSVTFWISFRRIGLAVQYNASGNSAQNGVLWFRFLFGLAHVVCSFCVVARSGLGFALSRRVRSASSLRAVLLAACGQGRHPPLRIVPPAIRAVTRRVWPLLETVPTLRSPLALPTRTTHPLDTQR